MREGDYVKYFLLSGAINRGTAIIQGNTVTDISWHWPSDTLGTRGLGVKNVKVTEIAEEKSLAPRVVRFLLASLCRSGGEPGVREKTETEKGPRPFPIVPSELSF